MKSINLLSLACLTLLLAGCNVEIEAYPSTTSIPPAANSVDIDSVEVQHEKVDPATLQELSALLQKRAKAEKATDEEKQQIADHLIVFLPSQEYIGEENQWNVTCHDSLIELNLVNTETKKRHIWFHVLYKTEKNPTYGSEGFLENYRGMGMKDVHYFMMAGKLEIRAVAESGEYKDDAKIKGILAAFNLKEIEKL